jgi:hypothetical protein
MGAEEFEGFLWREAKAMHEGCGGSVGGVMATLPADGRRHGTKIGGGAA